MNRFHHVSPQVAYTTMVFFGFVRTWLDTFFQRNQRWVMPIQLLHLPVSDVHLCHINKKTQNCLNQKSWFYWLSWPKIMPKVQLCSDPLLLRAPTWKHSWKSIMLHPDQGLFKVKGQIVSQPLVDAQPLVDSMGDVFFIDRLKISPLAISFIIGKLATSNPNLNT